MSVSCQSNPSADSSFTTALPAGGKIVVVGGGMAAFGFCKRLVSQELHQSHGIVVFCEERQQPYDRVDVSKLFSGTNETELQLAENHWYRKRSIAFKTCRQIVSIDRKRQRVIDSAGNEESYDSLVLATGSRPCVPPIDGTQAEGVFVYRTIDDLMGIRDFVQQNSCRTSAVIGGGLLGLEAAKVMLDLGLKPSILEVAPGLMPRQLDAVAAKVLREKVEQLGVDVHLTRRTTSMRSTDRKITLNFDNAEPLSVDIVIIAAGIRPRDELARNAGLVCDERGGVLVNERLQSSDPNVFAIGECASVEGKTYGLVAPCYRMADILADRLAGKDSQFLGSEESGAEPRS